MPELPEVENIVRGLRKVLSGTVITRVKINSDEVLNLPRQSFKRILDRKIAKITRVGKYIVFHLEKKLKLIIHLGMTGQLFLSDHKDKEDKHTHVVFSLKGLGAACERPLGLNYRDIRKFGHLNLIEAKDFKKVLGKNRLGPDALRLERKKFLQIVGRRKSQIKAVLLNQRILSGLGNIYSDESLFLARIHPRIKTEKIETKQLRALHKAIKSVLKQAIRAGGSSVNSYIKADGQKGRYQFYHKVYGRAGEPCSRCGTKIRKIKVSGRGSSYCPLCQKLA